MTPEGRVKRDLDRMVNELRKEFPGKVWWYSPQAGAYGKAGTPDRIGCVNGRLLAVECKTPGNRPTRLQQQSISALSAAGATCFVYYGEAYELDAIKRWIEGQLSAEIMFHDR